MFDQNLCTICETPLKTVLPVDPHLIHQKCPRCGEFKVTPEDWPFIAGRDEADRVKISGWVSDQNRTGVVPKISEDVLKKVLARPLPTGGRFNLILPASPRMFT